MTPPSDIRHGPRVRLAALEPPDLATIAHWYEDAELLRLYDACPALPKSEAQLAHWLEERQKATDTFPFAIRPADGDLLLGIVELDEVLWPHGVCGMSILIGERANWGQGYGTEAAQLALAFAFHELNLYRVTVTVFSYNERSIALFEKLGFQREGVFREFLRRDGRRYDMLLYGLLAQEWEAHR